MRTNFDLSPFRRSTVGFDRLFEMLENGLSTSQSEAYPPFDLERDGDDRYRITLAVAGFRQDEIEIVAQQNMLIVSGRKAGEDDGRYVHRGIAARSFERRFALGDYVKVDSAELSEGLLRIDLVREVPEEMKPRRIEIGGGSGERLAGQRQQIGNDNQAGQKAA